MKASLRFTGLTLAERRTSGQNEIVSGIIGYELVFEDGVVVAGESQIQQIINASGENVIEVFPPKDVPKDRFVPYRQFATLAKKFFMQEIENLN